MSIFKRFLGQTAIYGGGWFLLRILNYLIVSLYLVAKLDSGFHYGAYREFFFYIGFLVLFLGMRMETTFFRFARNEESRKRAFTTGFLLLSTMGLLFWLSCMMWAPVLAQNVLGYGQYVGLVRLAATLVVLDVALSLPLASFRVENRPLRFSLFKIIQIGLFILWVMIVLEVWPRFMAVEGVDPSIDNDRILYLVFWGYVLASGFTLFLLIPKIVRSITDLDLGMIKEMVHYGVPLLVVVVAGFVISNGYTLLMKYFLDSSMMDNVQRQGLFSAVFQLAMIMTIFTSAYNFAAEPFFFEQSGRKDAKEIYAILTRGYTIAAMLLVVVVLLAADFMFIFGIYPPQFRANLYLLPFLLLASLLQGIYYNVSVWYKIKDATRKGALIAGSGAVIYMVCGISMIWHFQEPGAVAATILAYAMMIWMSYFLSKNVYFIRFDYLAIMAHILLGLGVFFLQERMVYLLEIEEIMLVLGVKIGFFVIYIGVVWWWEKEFFKNLIKIQ